MQRLLTGLFLLGLTVACDQPQQQQPQRSLDDDEDVCSSSSKSKSSKSKSSKDDDDDKDDDKDDEKDDDEKDSNLRLLEDKDEAAWQAEYDSTQKAVIDAKCAFCHTDQVKKCIRNGEPSFCSVLLLDFENVKKYARISAPRVETDVQQQLMPPYLPPGYSGWPRITADEKAALGPWFRELGEFVQASNQPEADETPEDEQEEESLEPVVVEKDEDAGEAEEEKTTTTTKKKKTTKSSDDDEDDEDDDDQDEDEKNSCD